MRDRFFFRLHVLRGVCERLRTEPTPEIEAVLDAVFREIEREGPHHAALLLVSSLGDEGKHRYNTDVAFHAVVNALAQVFVRGCLGETPTTDEERNARIKQMETLIAATTLNPGDPNAPASP